LAGSGTVVLCEAHPAPSANAVESGKAPLFLDDERKLDHLTSHFLIASVRMRQLGFEPAAVPAARAA